VITLFVFRNTVTASDLLINHTTVIILILLLEQHYELLMSFGSSSIVLAQIVYVAVQKGVNLIHQNEGYGQIDVISK
jgi:hypothetical protein